MNEYLSEHEAPIKESSSVLQSTEEQDKIKMITAFEEEGKKYKSAYDADWDKRLDFYKSKQWDSTRPAQKASPVINICRMAIQGMLPILTDGHPTFNSFPQEPTDYQFAKTISTLINHWWESQSMQQVLVEWIMDSMIYDMGIIKLFYSEEEQDIKVEVIDPRDILVNYGAIDFNRNCKFVIHKKKKSLGELKLLFPKYAKQIKADDEKRDANQSFSTDISLVSPTDLKSTDQTKPPTAVEDTRKTCTIWEIWIDSDETEEYEEAQESGENKKGLKKKYPNGELITYLPNQKLILQDIDVPYKIRKSFSSYGRFPFVKLVDSIMPREFWGNEGEMKPLMDINKIINKVLAVILDYMNFMGNPLWKVEKNSGVSPDRITNQIGLILQPSEGKINAIQRDIPPPLPAYIIELFNILMRLSEQISGITEVTQGRRPTGITAAEAIESLQEAAQTRIRLKERNMQTSLKHLGEIVIQLMFQYYKTPKVMKITGEGNEWPDYNETYIEETNEDKYLIHQKKYQYDNEKKTYSQGQWEASSPSKGIFDIRVMTGASLPFQKAERSSLALKLFEAGVIDSQELLSTLEWPNYQEVINRMQEKAQEAQAMEAQNAIPK